MTDANEDFHDEDDDDMKDVDRIRGGWGMSTFHNHKVERQVVSPRANLGAVMKDKNEGRSYCTKVWDSELEISERELN